MMSVLERKTQSADAGYVYSTTCSYKSLICITQYSAAGGLISTIANMLVVYCRYARLHSTSCVAGLSELACLQA